MNNDNNNNDSYNKNTKMPIHRKTKMLHWNYNGGNTFAMPSHDDMIVDV